MKDKNIKKKDKNIKFIDIYRINEEGLLVKTKEVFEYEYINEKITLKDNILLSEAIDYYRRVLNRSHPKVKSIKTVSGSKKKIRKQKGTGRSRISTGHRGGAPAHGENLENKKFPTIPTKKIKKSLKLSLDIRVTRNRLVLIESINLETPNSSLLRNAFTKGIVVDKGNTTLKLSVRNLKDIKYVNSNLLNTFNLMKSDKDTIYITVSGLNEVIKRT